MKTDLKQRLINVLKTDKVKFNRYIRFSLNININFRANLYGANLSGANLSGANLSGANLYGANLSGANLSKADLSYADLSYANLYGANLSGANLSKADLSYADLSYADLSMANLSGANLSGANLSYANLYGANLDFGQWPLWCGSLKAKTDVKIRIQLAFHFASLIKNSDNATDEEKEILEHIKSYANKFHRKEVERL